MRNIFIIIFCLLQLLVTIEASIHISTNSSAHQEEEINIIHSDNLLQNLTLQIKSNEKLNCNENLIFNHSFLLMKSKIEIKNSINIKKTKEFTYRNITQIYISTKFAAFT